MTFLLFVCRRSVYSNKEFKKSFHLNKVIYPGESPNTIHWTHTTEAWFLTNQLGLDGMPRYEPLTRYAKLRVAHAPGMPRTFCPPPRVSNPDMHQGTCLTHVPWCVPGSLTSGFLWSRRRSKHSRHSRHVRNPQICPLCTNLNLYSNEVCRVWCEWETERTMDITVISDIAHMRDSWNPSNLVSVRYRIIVYIYIYIYIHYLQLMLFIFMCVIIQRKHWMLCMLASEGLALKLFMMLRCSMGLNLPRQCYIRLIESVLPNDAILWHRFESTLAERKWLLVRRQQVITWTNVDLYSVRSSDNHLRAISQEVRQPSYTKISKKLLIHIRHDTVIKTRCVLPTT